MISEKSRKHGHRKTGWITAATYHVSIPYHSCKLHSKSKISTRRNNKEGAPTYGLPNFPKNLHDMEKVYFRSAANPTQPPPPGSTNVRETQPMAHGLWGSILNTGICCRSISISWFIGSPTITVYLNEFFFFCHSEPTECSYFSSTESADARITQISLRQHITSKWAQRSSG